MKGDNLANAIKMLMMQLHEEEEDYDKVLIGKRTSNELSIISQRIESIKELLVSLNATDYFNKSSSKLNEHETFPSSCSSVL